MQNKNHGFIKGKGIRIFSDKEDDQVVVSDNTPDNFDPSSMLDDSNSHHEPLPLKPLNKHKKHTLGVMPILEPPKNVQNMANQVREQIYEEHHPSKNAITPKSAEELSKNMPAPIVIVDLTNDMSLIGCLHGLSSTHGGEFLHLDFELGTKSIIPVLCVINNTDLQLIKFEISVKGNTHVIEYKNKYKLKSVICKDFADLMTHCKLVFVRG